jgi:hypothetical protein
MEEGDGREELLLNGRRHGVALLHSPPYVKIQLCEANDGAKRWCTWLSEKAFHDVAATAGSVEGARSWLFQQIAEKPGIAEGGSFSSMYFLGNAPMELEEPLPSVFEQKPATYGVDQLGGPPAAAAGRTVRELDRSIHATNAAIDEIGCFKASPSRSSPMPRPQQVLTPGQLHWGNEAAVPVELPSGVPDPNASAGERARGVEGDFQRRLAGLENQRKLSLAEHESVILRKSCTRVF